MIVEVAGASGIVVVRGFSGDFCGCWIVPIVPEPNCDKTPLVPMLGAEARTL